MLALYWLDNALNALDDLNVHNDQAAVNALQAQSGNHITVVQADALIASAQAIIDQLNET